MCLFQICPSYNGFHPLLFHVAHYWLHLLIMIYVPPSCFSKKLNILNCFHTTVKLLSHKISKNHKHFSQLLNYNPQYIFLTMVMPYLCCLWLSLNVDINDTTNLNISHTLPNIFGNVNSICIWPPTCSPLYTAIGCSLRTHSVFHQTCINCYVFMPCSNLYSRRALMIKWISIELHVASWTCILCWCYIKFATFWNRLICFLYICSCPKLPRWMWQHFFMFILLPFCVQSIYSYNLFVCLLINVHTANVNWAGMHQSERDVGSHVCSMNLTLTVLWSRRRYKDIPCHFQEAMCLKSAWMWAHLYMAMTSMKFADMVMRYLTYLCAFVQKYTVY